MPRKKGSSGKAVLPSTALKGKSTKGLTAASEMKRPGFSDLKREASRLEAELATHKDLMGKNLTDLDLAAPHRAPYSRMRDIVFLRDKSTVESMVETLLEGSRIYEGQVFPGLQPSLDDADKKKLERLTAIYTKTRENVEVALDKYLKNPNKLVKRSLVVALNNLASNAPGLGPHRQVNLLVSDEWHLNALLKKKIRSPSKSSALYKKTSRSKGGGSALSKSLKVLTKGLDDGQKKFVELLTPRSAVAFIATAKEASVAVSSGDLITPSGRIRSDIQVGKFGVPTTEVPGVGGPTFDGAIVPRL